MPFSVFWKNHINNFQAKFKSMIHHTSNNNKPLIGQIVRNYLPLTQTFIYEHLKHTNSLVITDIAQNLKDYPFNCNYIFTREEFQTQKQVCQQFLERVRFPNCFETLLQNKKVEILHAHFGPMGYETLSLKKKLNVPLITSFHGYDASCMLHMPKWQQAYKRLFIEGDLFLVVGKKMAQRLQENGCPASKIKIQHVGIDLTHLPSSPTPPKPENKISLLYCGRLVEKKGCMYALLAFAQLAKKWPQLEFRIVGSGEQAEILKHTIDLLGLKNRVIMLGALSHAATLQEMHRAHLFILPSITASNGDMEGAPVVLMEAQAIGLPVLSTLHADIPEVVLDGKSGFLVPEKNVPALSEKLDYLLSHPNSWSHFGQTGKDHINQHYNIHRESKNMTQLYKDLLSNPKQLAKV